MLKLLLRLISVLMVLFVLAVGAVVIEYRHFTTTPLRFENNLLHYEVKPGMSLREVAQDLAQRGVIKHWIYLVGLAQWQGRAHQIKAGEYAFASGITPLQLLDQMVAGQVLEHTLTVIEGWTFRQLMDLIQGAKTLDHTLTGLTDEQIMARLGYPDQHPEGRFLPDTYRFPKNMTDLAFLQRAYQAMTNVLEKEWQTRSPGLPLNTPYEALILASIIEKETAVPSERGIIAGVFIRRLQKGMRLQTDPTVIYGMGNAYNGDIKRRDLVADTPYNTYLRTGLPPTPIALPGADAIHAALHPEPGTSLFFVARGDGSHEFSDTIEAHNKAVQKYQLKSPATSSSTKPVASQESKK